MENNTTENQTDQAAGAANRPAIQVGKTLAEARERLGLTVMDVSTQIKFAPRQIEALEADDYQRLPEAAFLRGFVRSYARMLHLDAQQLIAALPQERGAQASLVEPAGEAVPGARSAQRQNLAWLGAALVMVVIVAGFAAWHLSNPPEKAEGPETEAPVALSEDLQVDPGQLAADAAGGAPAPVVPQPPAAAAQPAVPPASAAPSRPASQTPAAQKPAAQPQAPSAQPQAPAAQPEAPVKLSSVRLVFNGESWTEVRDRDGEILSSRPNEPGSERRVRGAAPLTLVIGNASSVRLFYNDKEIDLIPHTRLSSDVATLTLE